ncbi:MAG: LysM peptidoglycan-binding domain-containing protein [Verrucomicrobiia bacterium]
MLRPAASSLATLLLGVSGALYSLPAQSLDPAQREDLEIERQRILRAADQIEVIVDQHNKIVRELDALKASQQALAKELAERKAENERLTTSLQELTARQTKERDALLKEVAKLVAENKATSTPAPPPPAATPKNPAPVEEGFEHVVARGETLWAITQAYRQAGVAVTMDDIRAANGLKDGQPLRVGQKLFIPKK